VPTVTSEGVARYGIVRAHCRTLQTRNCQSNPKSCKSAEMAFILY
jgi:hypothetical protein